MSRLQQLNPSPLILMFAINMHMIQHVCDMIQQSAIKKTVPVCLICVFHQRDMEVLGSPMRI